MNRLAHHRLARFKQRVGIGRKLEVVHTWIVREAEVIALHPGDVRVFEDETRRGQRFRFRQRVITSAVLPEL